MAIVTIWKNWQPQNHLRWEECGSKSQIFPKSFHKQEGSTRRVAMEIRGVTVGFYITRCACILLAALWILLLVTIPGLEDHTWYFVLVGALGIFYNAVTAGLKIDPRERVVPLKCADTIWTWKVMDGSMDLEVSHKKCESHFCQNFSLGELRDDEKEWWNAEPERRKNTDYDKRRLREATRRLRPRSNFAHYEPYVSSRSNLHAPPEPCGPRPSLGSRQERHANLTHRQRPQNLSR
jgi:hypothetical protein